MDQISSDNAFAAVEFAENPEPRVPCVLIVDTSTSMQGPRIDELNKGLQAYKQELLAASYFAQQDSRFQNGVYPERVHSYSTYDIFGRYSIDKHWSVSATVIVTNPTRGSATSRAMIAPISCRKRVGAPSSMRKVAAVKSA